MALSAALLLLLCCAGPALSSVDCSNETAQGTWLRDNTPSSCGIALFAISNKAYTPANVAHIKTVSVYFLPPLYLSFPSEIFFLLHLLFSIIYIILPCTHFGRSLPPPRSTMQICDDENCGQKFVDWLVSEKCRDQPIAVQTALELSRTLCASFNGSVDGTCVFSEAMGRVDQTAIAAILQNCLTWWTGTAQGMCPSGTCSSAIQTAVDRIKCCYNNFFSTETAVDITTK